MAHSLWVDIKAWRGLARVMPGWRPTLVGLQELDNARPEIVDALRSVSRGWGPEDPRWDVLQGVLEYTRREHAHRLAEKIREDAVRVGTDPGMDWAADLIDPEVP